jgi:hypothetical protein
VYIKDVYYTVYTSVIFVLLTEFFCHSVDIRLAKITAGWEPDKQISSWPHKKDLANKTPLQQH